ncbi:MAG: DUF2709 domain-containing protein [Chlamydiia bacterium]
MTTAVIPTTLIEELKSFFKKNRKPDLITSYLFFLEKKYHLNPVIFLKEKRIYKSKEELIHLLEKQGKLWRETEIKIQIGEPEVNEQTKKIYICPFSGKVFGDNTHSNPQDAIYDWVSTCKENTERVDGQRVKRFFVSEDLEVIKNYIKPQKVALRKIVFSSAVTGKLFASKSSVIEDFVHHQLKSIPLPEVPSQNRYEIQDDFLKFIEEHLKETQISSFVEAMSQYPEFSKYVALWLEEGEHEGDLEDASEG